jgi:hypothetical protein
LVASFDGLDGGARGRHDDWPAGYNAGQNRSSDYGKYSELDYFPDGPTIS